MYVCMYVYMYIVCMIAVPQKQPPPVAVKPVRPHSPVGMLHMDMYIHVHIVILLYATSIWTSP